MRLLFLALSYPLPANNGHKMRTLSLLRALAAEGHDVTFLVFARQDEVLPNGSALASVCTDIEIVPLALQNVVHGRDVARRLAHIWAGRPYGVTRFDSFAMQQAVQSRLRGERVDALICDAFTIVNVPPTGVPIVCNGDNLEHIILRRFLPYERNMAKRAYARLEAWKLERWERGVWGRSAVVMVCSEVDRHALEQLCPCTRTVVVPNVVDVEAYAPNRNGEEGRVLFHGSMDWYPNQDAVMYFISDILPRLRTLVPAVKFVVAGRNPSPALLRRSRGHADVEFTGTVSDMRDELARASVCVVPLRIGSGTRLKILEAGAMAKPIVSTTLGAEGLCLVQGDEILLADEPSAFAEAVAALLRNAERQRALGLAARERVAKCYSAEALQQSLGKALSGI